MTMDELKLLGLPVQSDERNLLFINSALNWLADNTTLDVAEDDFGKISALPSGAKLFLVKFCEVSGRDAGVASETVGPMSQSFSGDSSDKLIMGLARQLLKAYLKPNVKFIPLPTEVDVMKVKWKTKKNQFPKMRQAIAELDGRKVQAGVFGDEAWKAGIHEYGCKIRVTDAMRGYLHSQGLHLKESTEYIIIPERAFLRNGYDGAREEIIKDAETTLVRVLAGTFSAESMLKQVGEWMAVSIRDYARDLDSPPNHPFTVDRKGSENPLEDQGGMINAISYEVH